MKLIIESALCDKQIATNFEINDNSLVLYPLQQIRIADVEQRRELLAACGSF